MIVFFKSRLAIWIFMALLFSGSSIFCQTFKNEKKSKLKIKSTSIETSLRNGDDDLVMASKYEDLAAELIENNDLLRAEEYQAKAVDLYKKNKTKSKLAGA